jgi:disulfide bond formation protein DsbB
MTVWRRLLICGAGSAAMIVGALGFQYLGGLQPCPLCIWQRWPHVAGVVLAVLAITILRRHTRPLAVLGMLAMLISAGLGTYHTGIEQHWWPGPTSCTSSGISGLSTDELMGQIMSAPLVRCDEIVWEFLGLTMASWNAAISLGLAGLWLGCAIWPRNPYDSNSASQ